MRWNYVPTTPTEKLSFKKKLPNLNIVIVRDKEGLYHGSYLHPDVIIQKDTHPEKIRQLLETGATHRNLDEVINRIVYLKSYKYHTAGCSKKSLVAQAVILHENGQWKQLKTTEIEAWHDWHTQHTWPKPEKNTLKIEDIRGVTYESILHVSAAIRGTGPKVPSHIYKLHVPEYVTKSGEILNPNPVYWVSQ